MTSLKLFFFLSFINLKICTSTDSTTATTVIKDPESIVSRNGTFKLTFFSPPNSTNRYVGICYNKLPVKKAVWVANRNNPLIDSSGSFQISQDGNLQVLNSQRHILWTSNVTLSQVATNESKAQLLDTGNLMLFGSSNRVIWQSFDHPTDTFLPKMTLVYNKETPTDTIIQSWKTPSDPSQGRFTLGLGPSVPPELFIWDTGRRHYRTGPWNGNTFLGVEIKIPVFQIKGISIQTDGQGNASLNFFSPPFPLVNYELSYLGTSVQQIWDDAHGDWNVVGKYPNNECDIYGKCGDYGSCNSHSSPICKCLKGFEPKNRQEWNQGIWSSGCTRNRQLLCGIEGSKEDVFFSLPMMKPPADANFTQRLDQDNCRSQCLENCSCLAYAFDLSVGCMTWSGTLIDIQAFSSNGVDLYLRLEHSETGNSKNLKKVVPATLVSGIAILVAVLYFYCRRKTKQDRSEMPAEIQERNQSLHKFEELPLFKFREIAIATNNFEESNKLGEGGFGPVYKGMLEDGLEVAVKRLSGTSRQGKEEFMNEVFVISKLQHRNLVKLLGCCVEHQERLLIYEYLPNKSLDTFLFDLRKKEIFDWKKRFSIIEGICRGLLYLHRDSRLKIIHRDLKPGNILLDENLHPKISDFGMARIFGGDQNQADTTRVVGTYGYMPPEYAIEGRFSEKSDVFSFGVLLLEIITGRRTRWFDEESFNLLGHVWKHWSEDNVFPLIDPIIADQGYEAEILICIHIGLLCVQEYAKVRPDMSSVISMLSAESTANFLQPKPPGFTRLSLLRTQSHPSRSMKETNRIRNFETNNDECPSYKYEPKYRV